MLKCIERISFSKPIKLILIFLTLQINLSFLLIKIVSTPSKISDNPPPVYVKYNVNNKYVTFLFL